MDAFSRARADHSEDRAAAGGGPTAAAARQAPPAVRARPGVRRGQPPDDAARGARRGALLPGQGRRHGPRRRHRHRRAGDGRRALRRPPRARPRRRSPGGPLGTEEFPTERARSPLLVFRASARDRIPALRSGGREPRASGAGGAGGRARAADRPDRSPDRDGPARPARRRAGAALRHPLAPASLQTPGGRLGALGARAAARRRRLGKTAQSCYEGGPP